MAGLKGRVDDASTAQGVVPDSLRSGGVRARRKQLDATPSPADTSGDVAVT